MDRRLILSIILAFLLLSPCFADDYIIVPPEDTSLPVAEALSDLKVTPIYGTEDGSAILTEDQASNLTEQGYMLYPNIEVSAFINETVNQIEVHSLWNISLNGTNLTGRGQTICLVDSGIDANNFAFADGWDGKILAGQAFVKEGTVYTNQSCNSSNYTACLDDYGHGTKVAGIMVSQDPVYQGMAPDSKLVIVKILNSTGGGTEKDIVQALNYCTEHAGEYNISVISMSLGTSHNSTVYCDNESWIYPGLGVAIAEAVAENIIVVAASGNDHSSTNISSPACLYNATPVGSVNRLDEISGFSNYWDLPVIFAPGSNPYTTLQGGVMGYAGSSGTSYAVPHVSGVFALMRQYLALTNTTKSPGEIEDLAVATGVAVNSNPNNTRIDAYSLYEAMSASIFVDSPPGNSYQNNSILVVNGTSPSSDNTTVTIYNSTGSLVAANATTNSTWSLGFTLPDGIYSITANASDSGSSAFTEIDNVTVDTTPPSISITSPTGSTTRNTEAISIHITATDTNLNYTNISISRGDTTLNWTINTSTGSYTQILSVPADGTYNITATAYDNAGNMNSSTVENVTIFTSDTIGIRPSWSSTSYLENSTLSVGESETNSTSRRLYCNLNQTKTLQFYVNNSGFQAAQDLTVQKYGFSGLTANITWENGTDTGSSTSIAVNASAILNLTITCPSTNGSYSGEIYASSLNEGPYNYANLTLEIEVTGQTLPRLNSSGSAYQFNSSNITNIGFYVYFYDNQTIDSYWNASYNTNVTNSTQDQPLTFSVSSGLFSAQLNATNLSEGSYSLTGSFSDTSNNEASINLPFNLSQNIDINASLIQNRTYPLKGSNFTFSVNLSKGGETSVGSGIVCLSLPSGISNQTGSLCQSFSGFSTGAYRTNNWTLRGTSYGTYTVNITAYSSDGKFNRTQQQNVTVRYGALDIDWQDSSRSPPSQVYTSGTFTIRANVSNHGNMNLTDVSLDLSYSGTYFTLTAGDGDPCTMASLDAGDSDYCEWTFRAKTSTVTNSIISVTASATNSLSSSTEGEIDIVTQTQQQATQDNQAQTSSTQAANSSLSSSVSFTKPTVSTLTLSQGQNYILPVSVKNTGTGKLTNLYLALSGMESSMYTISSNGKSDLASGNTRDFNINFSIPTDAAAKQYSLTIKAMPEQGSWSKTLQLTIVGKGITVSGLENISVIQGQNQTVSYVIRSIGTSSLTNASLSIENINAAKYSLDPQVLPTISSGTGQGGQLSIFSSSDDEIGDKTLVFSASTLEGNFTYVFKMTILPSEEGKHNLTREYEDLSLRLSSLMKKYSGADKSKINATDIETEINATNTTLFLANESLAKGDYAQAQSLINDAKTSMSLLESDLPDAASGWPQSLFLAGAFAFGLLLVIIALVYSFSPKKKYVPSKLVTDPKKEPSKEIGKDILKDPAREQGKDARKDLDKDQSKAPIKEAKSKGLFSRLKFRKRQEETREKIVEEWLKRYELSKKNDPYGK